MTPLALAILALGAAPSGASTAADVVTMVTEPPLAILPATSTTAIEALALAARDLEGGRFDAALLRLRGLDPDPLVRWLRARAHIGKGAGDRDEDMVERARAALGDLPPERCLDPADDVPRVEVARLGAGLLAAEDHPGVARFEPGLRDPEAIDAVRDRAVGSTRTRLERRLLLEGAGSVEARRLYERLGWKGVLDRFPHRRARIELAEATLEGHDNERALALARRLDRAGPETDPDACRLAYVRGKAARKLRRYREARRVLSEARSQCRAAASAHPDRAARLDDRAIRSALLEARVLAILGRARALDRVVAWMDRAFPGHSYLDDALLWAAETHRGARAEERLERTLDLGGDQAPAAAWRLAFRALEAGRPDDARPRLLHVLTLVAADRDDRERAEHFLARIEARTATAAAAERWRALARRPSFYGFMALERLRDLDPVRATEVEAELRAAARAPDGFAPSPRIQSDPAVARAALWHRAGFSDWAEAELRALACALADPSPSDTLSLAAALVEVGARPAAQRLLRWDRRQLLDGPLTPDTVPVWRAAYSLAFVDEVNLAARAEEVEPLLLTALAREESTFDPDVVSWAGATGLAQLMPPTAIQAYADVFGGRLDLDRLVEPALNLRLGARVLKDGLRTFGGVEPLALSAYNGGEGLTRRTLPRRRVSFEVWVESNPVKENRGYVKRVTGTWGVYRLLHHPEASGPRLPDTIGPGAAVAF